MIQYILFIVIKKLA